MKLRKIITLTITFLFFTLTAFNQSTATSTPFFEKNKIDQDSTLHVDLNKIDLPYDSLFSLKLYFERSGEIKDSLLLVSIFQVALDSDTIDEQLVYSKIVDFSKKTEFTCKITYAGYNDIAYEFSASDLSYVNRTAIIPLERTTPKTAQELQMKKDAFIFIGSIYEENTKLRLPGVRIIIQDKFNPNKQFVEITDVYGTFKDSVFGYKLNEYLLFEIYLKKEGYISKSFVFEEKLTEYGVIDLVEYLKKIKLTKAEVGVEIGKAANLYPIYFDLDKSDIRRNAAKELNKVVAIMNELPDIKIELSSHTDSRATDRYNLALSQRRSNSSKNYLISKGIRPTRIKSVGYGEKQLANNCSNGVDCSEEQHSMNRRTEFKIVNMGEVSSPTTPAKNTKTTATNAPLTNLNQPIKTNDKTLFFKGQIVDSKAGKPIPFVEIVATNILIKSELYTAKADKNGNFTLETRGYHLGDKLYLDFLLSKNGYISKTFDYREKVKSVLDPIDLNKQFNDFKLVLIDLNVDIGKASNIAPILFELGKADINKEAAKELYQIAAILVEQPNLRIELGSHSDSRGDDASNLKLSQERANSTMHYLVSQEISYSRIKAVGYGEQQPVNNCINGVECSEEEHAANRRTEFVITRMR